MVFVQLGILCSSSPNSISKQLNIGAKKKQKIHFLRYIWLVSTSWLVLENPLSPADTGLLLWSLEQQGHTARRLNICCTFK